MTQTSQVRPCAECGWPALANTRRCPYCRTRMPGAGPRLAVPLLGLDLVRWAALAWCLSVGALSLAALTVGGWLPAMGGALIAVGPILFLAVLQQRSAARIRAISRAARSKGGSGRPPNNPPAHPEKPSRDAGRR